MSHDSPLRRPLGVAALVSIAVSFAIVFFAHSGSLFYAIHTGIGAIAWLLVAVLVLRSRVAGLGKPLAALLAFLTALLHVAYVVLFASSAAQNGRTYPFLAYAGFYDLFLEMLFGIGLIIWAMEDTERKLSTVHARARRRHAAFPQASSARPADRNLQPALSRREPAGALAGSGRRIDRPDRRGRAEDDQRQRGTRRGGQGHLDRRRGDQEAHSRRRLRDPLGRRRVPRRSSPGWTRSSPRGASTCCRARSRRSGSRRGNAGRAYKKFLSASVGVTPYSKRIPFDAAVEMADRMMYERKKAHKETRGEALERPRPRETPVREWDKPN